MPAGDATRHTGASGSGHALWVRFCHWVIVASVLTLGYSGIVILMAHPRLYWGNTGNDLTSAWLELPLGRNFMHGGWSPPTAFFADAGGPVSRIRTYEIFNQNGWARSLHFLVGWIFAPALTVYLIAGLFSGHLRRSLVPRVDELAPRRFWQDIVAHVRLRFQPAAGGPPYGLLQKWAYFAVVFIGLPVMILTGLSMSPAVGAAYPYLPALFGGSQSARTIHFLFLCALLLFLAVHVLMVVMTGFWRQMRAMTWGR